MIALRSIPRSVRWTVPLGLIGLVLTVPHSAPDGTGMQWDELVLGGVAAGSAWAALRIARTMDRTAGRPWRVLGYASILFMTAQWLAAAFPGPELDGFGFDDVLLFAGAFSPLVVCGMLARRVSRTRWPALVVDGLVIAVALLVVTEVVRTPLVNPANAPEDLRSLVLMYGAYAAVMLGGAAALCTVSTAALRRSVSIMIGAVAWQATAGVAEAMAIVDPSALWTATSDVAVAMGLQTVVVAAHFAPKRFADHTERAAAPVVSPLGMALVVAAMLSLPAALILDFFETKPLSTGAEMGCAVVFGLMALRLVLRMREDGRLTEDLVSSEEDFRELIEASSDGIAIMDGEFRLLFTSPAARSLLGLGADAEDEMSLLDLVDPADRDAVHAATVDVAAGEGPPLHLRVVLADGSARELEATSTERPGSGRRVLYLRDVTKRRRRERELERMAYTDHLTGLPNRAMLFRELGMPSLEDRCLLVLDLDGFKAVNDVAGHEAGDQLLVEVARRLNTVVREEDLVARLGGDEFAVIVTGTMAPAGSWRSARPTTPCSWRSRPARAACGWPMHRSPPPWRPSRTSTTSWPRASSPCAWTRPARRTAGSSWCTRYRSGAIPTTTPSADSSCGASPSASVGSPNCRPGCCTRRASRSPRCPTTGSASRSAFPPVSSPPRGWPPRSPERWPRPGWLPPG
jgi:PAS domain S-box-containing protein